MVPRLESKQEISPSIQNTKLRVHTLTHTTLRLFPCVGSIQFTAPCPTVVFTSLYINLSCIWLPTVNNQYRCSTEVFSLLPCGRNSPHKTCKNKVCSAVKRQTPTNKDEKHNVKTKTVTEICSVSPLVRCKVLKPPCRVFV